MITADADFVVIDSVAKFTNAAEVLTEATFLPRSETVFCNLIVLTVDGEEVARYALNLRQTDVDAETGSGTGETATWHNAVEQAVVTYLEGLTGNAGITFTVGS